MQFFGPLWTYGDNDDKDDDDNDNDDNDYYTNE